MNYEGKTIKVELSIQDAKDLRSGVIPENLLTQLYSPWCLFCGEVSNFDDPNSCPCGGKEFVRFK